jgi:hypothetical protein
MFITLYEPIVSPLEDFYKLTSVDDKIKIRVGFNSLGINISKIWSERRWYVRDLSGTAVQSGKVNVKLNTFDAYVEVTGLEMGGIYTFSIENPEQGSVSSATISSVDVGAIGVIDENARFVGMPGVVGDLELYASIDPVTGSLYRRVRFPASWVVTRSAGNGVVVGVLEGTEISLPYAYVPYAIYTYDRSAPASVVFSPLRGMATVDVPIRQLPVIRRVANSSYSVDPPTRVRVVWRTSLRGVAVSEYTSRERVAVLSMGEVTSERVVGVVISPMYD